MKTFPFFKQTEIHDCGPACLKMICDFFGKKHSIEYIKNISGLNERGVSMYNLEQAGKRLGFESFGVKYNIEELFESQLPCIIHWNAGHFVVIPPQKYTGREILIANPATGLQHITKKDFLRCWLGSGPGNEKGYVLQVQDKKKTELLATSRSFRYFMNYLLPYRNKFVIILVLLAISGMITFIQPFISKNIIDEGINKREIYFVLSMLLAQLFLFLGNTTIEVVRSWTMLHINNSFGINILRDFLIKLTKLPISYFDKKNVGDLQQRISDHSRIQYFLTSNSVSIIFSVINFISLFITLACFNKSMLLIIVIFSSVNVIWILYFLKRRKEIDYARFYNRGTNQDNINEIILGMQDIKLNNLEEYKIETWYKTQEKQNQLNFKMMKVDQKQSIGSSSLDQVENIIISFFSALAVIKGNMTLGMMMSINLIAGQLKGTITQFLYLIRSYQEASISLERLMEVHKNKNEDEGSSGLILQEAEIGDMTMENVSFKYDLNGPYVLKNINLKIPKGSTIAIVGESGSGKSTLLKLLLKYNSPTEGKVFVNKTDLKDISSKWWWQKCGTVMQEGYIFSDTIENNIAIHENAEDATKMEATKDIANISEFIRSMPSKGETRIGPAGTGISGGQKQRLLIARAVYKNPEILFFDEATSSLDSENEEIIMQNLDRFFKNKIMVIIAHRFSTIKNADKIIVLEKGEIIEEGSHEQLMSGKGKYFKLFSRQIMLEKVTSTW